MFIALRSVMIVQFASDYGRFRTAMAKRANSRKRLTRKDRGPFPSDIVLTTSLPSEYSQVRVCLGVFVIAWNARSVRHGTYRGSVRIRTGRTWYQSPTEQARNGRSTVRAAHLPAAVAGSRMSCRLTRSPAALTESGSVRQQKSSASASECNNSCSVW